MKRPLWAVLGILIIGILLFYRPDPGTENYDRDYVSLSGVIDEITGAGDKTALLVRDVVTEEGERFCNCLKVYAAKSYRDGQAAVSFEGAVIGSVMRMSGTVQSFRTPGNPGQFDEAGYYRSLGIDARMYAKETAVIRESENPLKMLLYRIRTGLYQTFFQVLPEREAGILSAMVLGEKSGLDEEIRELYRENGIAHILAISGLHISLIGMGLFAFLRKYVMPMSWAVVVTGVVLFLYGVLIGFPLATRRAVIMTMLVLIARLLGRRHDRPNALALAAIVELVIHPASLTQSGFLLSYGTVLGIILFVGEFSWVTVGKKHSVTQKLFDVFTGSAGVFFVTLPILVQCYHEVAVFAVPVNLVLLPFMSLLLGTGLIGGLAAVISLAVSRFVTGAAYCILRIYQGVCGLFSSLPGHTVIIGHRSAVGLVLYYLGLAAAIVILHKPGFLQRVFGRERGYVRLARKRRIRLSGRQSVVLTGVLIVNLVLFFLPVTSGSVFPAFSYDGITITNLDVGQGDCSCIRLDNGVTVLIDGGSTDVKEVGRYRIVPFLKYCGIDTIDWMIITHSDEDHISGLTEILEREDHFGLSVKNVVLPDIDNPDDNYIQFEHVARTADGQTDEIPKIVRMSAGDELRFEDAVFTCLHPSAGYAWEDANDYSTVMELSYGEFRALFTGDLGFHGEEAILSAGEGKPDSDNPLPGDVDYLKVGHHGSKYSSSESFLAVIKPEIAVASAGEGNRYHHPSKEAVERIRDAGGTFFCTMESGAVTTWTDGETIRVDEFK